jgi:hypothetical protein
MDNTQKITKQKNKCRIDINDIDNVQENDIDVEYLLLVTRTKSWPLSPAGSTLLGEEVSYLRWYSIVHILWHFVLIVEDGYLYKKLLVYAPT